MLTATKVIVVKTILERSWDSPADGNLYGIEPSVEAKTTDSSYTRAEGNVLLEFNIYQRKITMSNR